MINQFHIHSHNGSVGAGVKGDIVHLGNEDGGDGDEEGRPVHVDRGADGKHELGDPKKWRDALISCMRVVCYLLIRRGKHFV